MTDYVHIDITPLVQPPSVEEEFTMEKNIVVLNECQDKEELRKKIYQMIGLNEEEFQKWKMEVAGIEPAS